MRCFASLLPLADSELLRSIAVLNDCVDGFHIDIMDNTLVPYEAGSVERIAQVRSLSSLPLWIHLMVDHPQRWINQIALCPRDIVSIHYEALCGRIEELRSCLAMIRHAGASASLAFSPQTPLGQLHELQDALDQVLIMGVVPGKSGQAMLENTRDRLQAVYTIRKDLGATFLIGLDGGVSLASLRSLEPYFPDDIVAGASIVQAQNPCEVAKDFHSIVS